LPASGVRVPKPQSRDVAALLAPGDISVVTQPIVRLADGETVGFEVLARSASLAHLSPDQWLSMADEAGCRVDVELACLRAATQLGAVPGGARLFLNASARLLLDRRVDDVIAGLPGHVFEITEHERVGDYATLTERLLALSSKGSLLAVDDVGAGYANMAHVLRLSPQFIKIDRSIVSGLHCDRDRRALIAALVAFAVACGAQTIAEGVEEAAELEALRDIGVDLVQGYLIARPGQGWPAPCLPDADADAETLALLPLSSRVERTADLRALAHVVTDWLYEEHRLMPSIYLERAGVLRCVSRRGQWIVHDGMAPGAGVTGTAFALDRELWVPDVHVDPTYRAAIPGVRSELCIPLHAGGRAIGVLNVESFDELGERARRHTREAARLIEERLAALDAPTARDGALRELSRACGEIVDAPGRDELARAAAASAIAVSGLTSAALWWLDSEGPRLGATSGPGGDVLGGLDAPAVGRLFDFVAGVTSCHTGGGPRDLAASFLGASFESVARAMLVVPLRSRGQTLGLLAATCPLSSDINSEVVEATELLGLHTATAAIAYHRMGCPWGVHGVTMG
jgi:EAL domain-containing protein (putative c-di-GMP-specific phosphodiesterase class I)